MKNEEIKKKKTTKKSNTKGEVTKKEEIKKNKKSENKIVDEALDGEVTYSKKSNKGDIILILGLVVVAILGFLVMKDVDAGPKYELPLTLTGEAGLHQLTYAEYQEKIDNNEEFVIILERATCSHCVTYMPIAEQFASDNKLPMYYVDTDTFTAEDWEGFEKSNSYLRKAKGDWGTPTTLVLAGSETVDYVVGVTEADALKEMYNKYFDIENE